MTQKTDNQKVEDAMQKLATELNQHLIGLKLNKISEDERERLDNETREKIKKLKETTEYLKWEQTYSGLEEATRRIQER